MLTETTQQAAGEQASTEDAIEVLLRSARVAGVLDGDTAATLVELYERIERAYRAAAMAGRASGQVSSTTNFA